MSKMTDTVGTGVGKKNQEWQEDCWTEKFLKYNIFVEIGMTHEKRCQKKL